LEENALSAPDEDTVGSKVIVSEPVQGSTGLPLGVKPDAVKLSVSLIVAALAVFMAPALSATAQIVANKAKDFMAVPYNEVASATRMRPSAGG
jgi:hypothetical protein